MPEAEEPRVHRCGRAARWLPRVLAGAVLGATLVAAYAVDPDGTIPRSSALRGLLAVLGGTLALWIVRKGAEVRLEVLAGERAVGFRDARGETELAYDRIGALDYATALGASRNWLPALLLVDRDTRAWRIPALIEDGDVLLRELLGRCGRADLQAWADARGLVARMRRAPLRILATGYAAALALAGAAIALWTWTG